MIKGLIQNFLINVIAIWVVANYTGALHLAEGLKSLLLVGAAFTALYIFVKPILSAILGPLNFITLGLVGLVIDSVLLFALTKYLPEIWITPWSFPGATVASIILPAYNFNLITATVLSALILNIIRQTLSTLVSK